MPVAPGWRQLPRQRTETTQKGHGRIEKRRLTSIVDEHEFPDWPGGQQVFMLEREVTTVTTGHSRRETVLGSPVIRR